MLTLPADFCLQEGRRKVRRQDPLACNEGSAQILSFSCSVASIEPHIGIGAAIGYVRRASYRSKGPVLKMNAPRTLTELQNLYQSQASPAQLAEPIQQLPETVLAQFIAIEADGIAIAREGSEGIGPFLCPPCGMATRQNSCGQRLCG